MNHYPHHIGDFVKDTLGFSQGAIGAYRLLLDAYYANEEAIDAESVYVIGRATTPAERKNVDKALGKFVLENGRYYHKRAEEELGAYRKRSGTGSENAEKRWRKDAKSDANPMPEAMPTECQTNAGTDADGMLASSHKPVNPKTEKERRSPGDSGTARHPPPAGAAPSSAEPESERFHALHGICVARRIGVRDSSSVMHLRQFAGEGVADQTLLDAITIARKRKPEPEALPLGYLVPIVVDLRNGKLASPALSQTEVIARALARTEEPNVAH